MTKLNATGTMKREKKSNNKNFDRKYILPQKFKSPAKDAFEPVNEKKGKGTGIGTLMPTYVKEKLLMVLYEFKFNPKYSQNYSAKN